MLERKRGGFIDLVCVWRMFSDETFFSVPAFSLCSKTCSSLCFKFLLLGGLRGVGDAVTLCVSSGGREEFLRWMQALPEITIILYLLKSLDVKLHSLGKLLFATESAWSSFFSSRQQAKEYNVLIGIRQAL